MSVTPREAIDHALSVFSKTEVAREARLAEGAREVSLARQWQDGELAQMEVEGQIDELWPDIVHHIGTDHYDNSLEVCFAVTAPSDLCISNEQAQVIRSMGFGRCWLNFLDNTEQFAQIYPATEIWPRKTVANPHWTPERLASFKNA